MARFGSMPGGEQTSFAGTDVGVIEPSGGSTKYWQMSSLETHINDRYKFGCRVRQTTADTATTATWTAFTWDTETFDNGAMHSTVSNTERITIPAGLGGVYVVSAIGGFVASASGAERGYRIFLNGTTSIANIRSGFLHATLVNLTALPAVLWEFSATDYVELQGYQDTGGNLDTATGSSWLSAHLLWRT